MARFLSKLTLELPVEGRLATIVAPLKFESDYLNRTLTAIVGTRTNLATTPRLFWPLYPPFGKWSRAAALHDYLYTYEPDIDRATADAILFEAMRADGCRLSACWFFWCFVRMLGRFWWSK